MSKYITKAIIEYEIIPELHEKYARDLWYNGYLSEEEYKKISKKIDAKGIKKQLKVGGYL